MASLVLGLVGFVLCGVGSVLAIVFGHIALARYRRSAPAEPGRGMAIAGLVLGYVGAVLVTAGILFLVLASDDDSGRSDPDVASTSSTVTVPPTSGPSGDDVGDANPDRERPDPEPPPADTPSDALEVETLIEGSGPAAASGDTVVVHYVGLLADGTEFDTSWDQGEPFMFTLGQGQVIPGWDEGLVGARVGERRRLVVGSDNGYGSQGNPSGGIPANAPMAFEVDVLDVR